MSTIDFNSLSQSKKLSTKVYQFSSLFILNSGIMLSSFSMKAHRLMRHFNSSQNCPYENLSKSRWIVCALK